MKGVAGRPRLYARVLLCVVHILLAIHGIERLLGHHLHRLQHRAALQRYMLLVDVGGQAYSLLVGLVPHKRHLQQIQARIGMYTEPSVHVGRGAAHKDRVHRAHKTHIDERQRLTRGGIRHSPLNGHILGPDSPHRHHYGHCHNRLDTLYQLVFHCIVNFSVLLY